MRLNQTMREKLKLLIMADTKFTQHSQEELRKALAEAEKTRTPKDVTKFFAKYPEYAQSDSLCFSMKARDVFTDEQLKEIKLDPKYPVEIKVLEDDSCWKCIETVLTPKAISAWFAEEHKCDFVKMITENLFNDFAKNRMCVDLDNFLSNCTTDKQIILTYPEFEKYFNQAGIIASDGGKQLPVPTTLTNAISKYLK